MELIRVGFTQMSFMGAGLIVAIIAIRKAAMNHLPKRTFLALWGIAVMRLCIPFRISFDFLSNTPSMMALKENISNTTQNIGQATYPMDANMDQNVPILFMIWVTGVCICLLFFLVTYLQCMRRFAASFPVCNEYTVQWMKAHKLRRKIEIRESGVVNTPLTYGVLHPVILVPKRTNWNDEEKMSYILEHEFVHITRMDIVRKGILILILSIHWFNPMVWIMYLLCNRDLELACDEMVILHFGMEKRSDYAYVLINMEESKSSFMPMCNYFSKNVIEERIVSIMKTKKASKTKILSASVLVLGVFLLGIFSISANAKSQHSGTALELPTAWESTTSTEQSLSAQLGHSAMFPEYEQYGLSYDEKSGYLMYDNQTVGYFKDEYKKDTFCRFVEETGEIGVEVKRDADWNISGMATFPMSDVMTGETLEINITNNTDNSSSATDDNTAKAAEPAEVRWR